MCIRDRHIVYIYKVVRSRLLCAIRNRTPAADIIRRRRLQLFGHIQSLNLKWITVVLYVPQFGDLQLTGNDLEGDQDRYGLELLKTI